MTTTFVLAGGCYWCLDAAYRALQGIVDVHSCFTGGHTPYPSYEQVCTGSTGHAEAVAVTFDESVLPVEVVLDAYFTMHDPTQLNRQGNDIGTQYRSGIYVHNDAQASAAAASLQAYQQALSDKGYGAVTTEIAETPEFYFAEDYHQQYLAKNPNGYCGIGGTGVTCPIGVGVQA